MAHRTTVPTTSQQQAAKHATRRAQRRTTWRRIIHSLTAYKAR